MKMKNRSMGLLISCAVLPLVLVAFFYRSLPLQIPMSWGFNGTVRYDDRWRLWVVAGLAPLMAVLFQLMPKIDPHKENYKKFQDFYFGFQIVMQLFITGMVALVISESLYPGRISIPMAVTAFLGLLFAFVGNMMPKVKSNFFMGIKNPWTLSSTQVWNKTHRLAGRLWFGGGLLAFVSAFVLPPKPLFVFFY